MPTHRVIGSLGQVSVEQAAAFKAAFQAARTGAAVQVLDAGALDQLGVTAQWSRDWLDVAACLQAWQDSGLDAMVRSLLSGHEDKVHPADIVAALVVQRCVAPDSKLAACDWFDKTALPELLGVQPARFHNTRLHRVLDRLEQVDADLQCAMADLLRNSDGQPCTAVFVDCTDTWFTGSGPEMAERGKTKEGFYPEKIGILLVCRQDGMPLRFKVLRGNTEDGKAMLQQLSELAKSPWLASVPVVADRALGNTADLLEMRDLRIPFVTALVASEHKAYGAALNCPALLGIDPEDTQCLDKAGAAVVAAGMTRHAPDLYVLDLAVVQRDADDRGAVADALGEPAQSGYRRGNDLARDTLQQAHRYRVAVRSGKIASYEALRRGLGRSSGHLDRVLRMLKLPEDVQARILAGEACNLTKRHLEQVCKGRLEHEHRRLFDQLCAAALPKHRDDRRTPAPPNDAHQPWVLCVLALAVQRWIALRLASAKSTASTDRALGELRNVRLVGQLLPKATEAIAQPNAATALQRDLATALGVQWALQGGTASKRLKKVR